MAFIAQAIGDFLGIFCRRVEQHQSNVGIVHAIGVDGAIVATRKLRELGENLGDYLARGLHGLVLLHLVVDQIGVIHVRPEGHRLVRVERRVWVLALTQEGLHCIRLVEAVDAALLVTGQETVVRDDDRQPHIGMLADPNRAEVHVVDRLRVASHQDDPTGIEDEVDIRVVTTNIERSRYGARRNIQYHGHARTRLHGQLLERVQQALRRRGIQDAAAAERSAIADARRAVFAVGRNHDDIVFAIGLHFGQILGDFG